LAKFHSLESYHPGKKETQHETDPQYPNDVQSSFDGHPLTPFPF